MSAGYDVYGGWQPTTLDELLECEEDQYITEAGVTPDWVLAMQAAVRECRAGHPTGLVGRARCGVFGCQGVAS